MFLCNSATGWQLDMILSGEKQQITVIPREQRHRVGDKVWAECYIKGVECCLGDMIITDVIRYQGFLVFSMLDNVVLESWAKAEGFPNFAAADKIYRDLYGPNWKDMEFDCLKFRGSWIPEAV